MDRSGKKRMSGRLEVTVDGLLEVGVLDYCPKLL